MVKLEVDYLELYSGIDKLIDLLYNIGSLQPRFAKLVAEILLLRLFSSLEETIMSMTTKIGCGALYIDGSQPRLAVRSKSRQGAIDNMVKYGRKKPRWPLQWSQVKEVKENVRYIIDPNEHFLIELDRHMLFIEEMRWIRNRIAHNDTRARANYRKAILRYYGGYVNSVTPGTLLLSPRQNPVLIEQYLKKSRILVKTLVKG
jgi:hypothetical protein